jgi:DNA-binding response OmpR family regulator
MTNIKTLSYESIPDLLQSIEAQEKYPLAVFVDIHLASDQCGLDVIPQVKAYWPRSVVIAITSDEKSDLITQALTAGADDFIRKPFTADEIKARLKARLRDHATIDSAHLIEYGDVEIDTSHLMINGPKGRQPISLKECKFLEYLIRSAGMLVSKAEVKRHLWGNIKVSDNALDRKIFELRRALKSVSDTVFIQSIYGEGIAIKTGHAQSNAPILHAVDQKQHMI